MEHVLTIPERVVMMEISQLAVAVTAGVLMITGVVSGIFPALKAARVDPVESLRYK